MRANLATGPETAEFVAMAGRLLRLMLVMMLMPGGQCKRKRKSNDKKKKNELERVLQAAERGDLYEVLGVKRDAASNVEAVAAVTT